MSRPSLQCTTLKRDQMGRRRRSLGCCVVWIPDIHRELLWVSYSSSPDPVCFFSSVIRFTLCKTNYWVTQIVRTPELFLFNFFTRTFYIFVLQILQLELKYLLVHWTFTYLGLINLPLNWKMNNVFNTCSIFLNFYINVVWFTWDRLRFFFLFVI